MRVGLITNPPWVNDSSATADGVEQQLVKELAARVGARIEWVRRPEAELLEALHARELDLVIGGLTSAVPWQKQVAFTKPYYTDTTDIGAPPGSAPPGALTGRTVAVQNGSAVAAELKTRGAAVVRMDDIARATALAAAPTWQLARMGYTRGDLVLQQQKHVIAAPQGENAWLVEIEHLLHDRKSQIPQMLRTHQ
jgi:ABC-type amino acid transport substrate-binding protein